ncbi:MAG TPA: FUSC family protein [Solirubrobacteraceae bacterium]|nr:FUSC family protein [Solirubrobacteraceae bacterium]
MSTTSSQRSTVTTLARAAVQFNRAAVSPTAGALAAIPMVALLGGLIAAGQPVAGITSAVGAMFVAIAWRVQGGRPPYAVMATDAVLMALATFAGCLSGHILWLHLVILAAFSLAGGLLVGLGRAAGIVGFQSLLAVVVFGRFAEPLGPAAGIAGLVGAGGLAQVAFLIVVRWPPPLVAQRRATAAAYRELAELAAGDELTSALPAATALDEARTTLSGGTLFGASAIAPLRSLVNEGHRLRVAITALNGLAGRIADSPGAAAAVHAIGVDTRLALQSAADGIEGSGHGAEVLERLVGEITRAVADLQARDAPDGAPDTVWVVLVRRLAALAGQLRAVAGLVPAAAAGSGLRDRRPHRRTSHPLRQLRTDLAELRANLSLDSPPTRHALRLAVIVPGTELLAGALPLQRGYWVVVAAAATIRPEFGATFTRGIERVGGTALGVALAGLIATALHPGEAATVGYVGLFAWAAMSTFAASYALGFSCITALVVFLLNTLAPDTFATASARLVDTLIGGAVGLAVFAAWPTWSRRPAQELLSELADALRRYGALILEALIDGVPVPDRAARASAREARLARAQATAAVGRSLSEPARRRIDARVGSGVLDEMLRLVHAMHALRLEAQDEPDRAPLPALQPFARALDVQLAAISRALRSDELRLSSEYVDLRSLSDRFGQDASTEQAQALAAIVDELADATNSIDELIARG